jgi:hypothetical protein
LWICGSERAKCRAAYGKEKGAATRASAIKGRIAYATDRTPWEEQFQQLSATGHCRRHKPAWAISAQFCDSAMQSSAK